MPDTPSLTPPPRASLIHSTSDVLTPRSRSRLRARSRRQAYCWWGTSAVYSPYYGAAFVSEFLGTDGTTLAALDGGTSAIATYAVYSGAGAPLRLLVVNTNYFDGSGTRAATSVTFTGLSGGAVTKAAKRLTAPDATARTDEGTLVTIGGNGTFSGACVRQGTQGTESVAVSGGALTVSVLASEALIVYL